MHGLWCDMASIARPSVASLFIKMLWDGRELATGTAFVVWANGGTPYLVTNRHNLAGRRSDNNELLSSHGVAPEQVSVFHNAQGSLGKWDWVTYRLHDEAGRPKWYEHPTHGRKVDVVALPLDNVDGVELYPYDPWADGPALRAGVSDSVSIIGFPFALSVQGLAVWSKGAIASEPAVDANGVPCFYIDSRTRPGQSGAPVVVYSPGGLTELDDGSSVMYNGPQERLLGVYSGRVNPESDLGIVWKVQALIEVLEGASRPKT